MKNKPNTKFQHDNDFWNEDNNQSETNDNLYDKHYHKIVYRVEPYLNNKNKWMRHKTTRLYSSGETGTNVRDAVTGYYYNIKVGSKEEDALFKVRLCHRNFEFPVTAFYNSPEEFEREHYTQLSNNTIQTVNKRQQQYK